MSALPSVVPVFAVPGSILLPRATLPLMVFEPRYLALVDDALGAGRLLALVQPRDLPSPTGSWFHATGCLGRITAFGETGDGRYLITVTGVCRFRVGAESDGRAGYRRVAADYAGFRGDLGPEMDSRTERQALLDVARPYLVGLGLGAELPELETLDTVDLLVRLAVVCLFSAEEKQALLEAGDDVARCRLLIALIQRNLLADTVSTSIH